MKIIGVIVVGIVWALILVQRAVKFSRKRKLPPYNH